ncbi:MAG: hypothetical protein IH605_02455 [Burkholderiales bacterium]|nr:hypothetical protein [Burkholderiales bacterium]
MPGLHQPETVTTVRVVNATTYPELPDIQLPLEPTLTAWQYEIPRDMSKIEAANTAKCQSVADKDRDDAYWARCGIHPVIADSNVLYGFDQRNWNIMLSNFGKLREYIVDLKTRIGLANDTRREWRRKAEEERKKAAAERAAALQQSVPPESSVGPR